MELGQLVVPAQQAVNRGEREHQEGEVKQQSGPWAEAVRREVYGDVVQLRPGIEQEAVGETGQRHPRRHEVEGNILKAVRPGKIARHETGTEEGEGLRKDAVAAVNRGSAAEAKGERRVIR